MNNKRKEYEQLESQLWPENKKNNNIAKKVVKVFLCIIVLSGVYFVGYGVGNTSTNSNDISKISKVYNLIKNNWYFSSEDENIDQTLVDDAIVGMILNDKDAHTDYFSAQEMQDFTSSVNEEFVGIGVMYTTINNEFIITQVFEGSPAQQAGLIKGDIITKVDDTDVTTLQDGVTLKDLVLGEAGTQVNIEVIRDNEKQSFSVTRENITTVVNGKILDNNIGVLSVYSFGNETTNIAKERLDEFVLSGVENLIIDLRNDGGGYLTSIVDLASLFVSKDSLILTTINNKGAQSPYYASGNNYTQFKNIVLLINGNTASAAEAFTLAMKQNLDNVTIVGTKSYGKGTVQDSFSLGDGSYLKLTTAKWFSPNMDNIDLVGIEPDYETQAYAISNVSLINYDDSVANGYDSVSNQNKVAQQLLAFLGYDIDREDGYLSNDTLNAIKQYCNDNDIEFNDILSKDIYESIINKVLHIIYMDDNYDLQLQKAISLLTD